MAESGDEKNRALQEIAKASSKAIDAGERLGIFLGKLIGEPFENAIGILGDRIRFFRWERQLRLIDRYNEITDKRGLAGKATPIPLKFALPAIEQASIEENDSLQDLWAKLLVSASDSERTVRTAFIEIIKQLESLDVQILEILYSSYVSHSLKMRAPFRSYPTKYLFPIEEFARKLRLSDEAVEPVIDNLARLSLVGHFRYMERSVGLTYLGYEFVRACVEES